MVYAILSYSERGDFLPTTLLSFNANAFTSISPNARYFISLTVSWWFIFQKIWLVLGVGAVRRGSLWDFYRTHYPFDRYFAIRSVDPTAV